VFSFHVNLRSNSGQFLTDKGLKRDELLAALKRAKENRHHNLFIVNRKLINEDAKTKNLGSCEGNEPQIN
jgi:hypothetical protein